MSTEKARETIFPFNDIAVDVIFVSLCTVYFNDFASLGIKAKKGCQQFSK